MGGSPDQLTLGLLPQNAGFLIVSSDMSDGSVHVVGEQEQVEILRTDGCIPIQQRRAEPVDERIPELRADQHHRGRLGLLGLHQRQRFEELVEDALKRLPGRINEVPENEMKLLGQQLIKCFLARETSRRSSVGHLRLVLKVFE